MKGTVDRQSDGAEFMIRLPVLAPEAGNSNDAAPEAPAEAPVARKTILIVDDESEIAELISEMVGNLGYQTLISNSGNAAAVLLADKSLIVDAILCDVRMPDGDGPSLYDWLSANRASLATRIGFVTGDTLGPSAGRFLAHTGCPVIEKPFVRADIARVVESLVLTIG
jgi:CheY-like chemotaxis protein